MLKLTCRIGVAVLVVLCEFVSSAQAEGRLPTPAESDLKESQATLKDIFKEDIDQATTPAKKLALARKLFVQAVETKDDPSGKYALLMAAKNLAMRSSDLMLSLDIADELGRSFEIDEFVTKVAVIKDATPTITSAEANRELCEAALKLLSKLLDADRYDLAKEVSDLASEAARKSKDMSVAKRVRTQAKEAEDASIRYVAAKASMDALIQNSTDPKASQVVGEFYCYFKANWAKGLPFLALADDSQIKSLAEQDLAEPNSHTARAKIGDGWWSLSETEDGVAKANLQRRATYWYQKAMPELSGLTKAKIEKRLASIASPTALSGETSATSANINLLADVAPAKHGDAGQWQKLDEAIATKNRDWVVKIEIPTTLPPQYDLDASVTISGEEEFSDTYFVLPHGAKRSPFTIRRKDKKLMLGFWGSQGQKFGEDQRLGTLLPWSDGQMKLQITFQVRKDTIAVFTGRKMLVSIRNMELLKNGDGDKLVLTTNTPTTFTELSCRLVSEPSRKNDGR
ncbi:MAG: hypothetical protein JSS27_08905 [Planctomycetes bacterium]|nr:hypothetical protein [Planctomycetota bacterium]